MDQDIFQKLAALSGDVANEGMPVEETPSGQAPVEQALPTSELPEPVVEADVPQDLNGAIEAAANEASSEVGDLLEDKPLESMPPPPPTEFAEPVLAPSQEEQLLAQLAALQGEQQQLEAATTERLAEYAVLARVAASAHDADEGFSKSAAYLLEDMLSDESVYQTNVEKIAASLFETQEDIDALYTMEAAEHVAATLDQYLLEPLSEKLASDLSDQADGNSLVNKTRSAVDGFVQSIQRLKGINSEIATLESKVQEAKDIHSQLGAMGAESMDTLGTFNEAQGLKHDLADAKDFRIKGYGLAALGAGALAGGAYMAGRAIRNHNQEEQSLNGNQPDATLNAGINSTLENGGTYKMANTIFMDEILKIAGANFLIGTANDPEAGEELNKLASDEFDRIASLGRENMEVEFVKTALANYPEETLREIVAGVHTEELLEKTAGFVALDSLSSDELEKVAGAKSVSAKGAAGALRDASEKVENILIQAKENAQGAGRQYAGENGKFGGALVNDMSGLNVVNNPGAYEIERTAQEDIEHAVLLKQAAEAAYHEADAFLKETFGN